MRSCSVQSLGLHSDNDHMQKSTLCVLRLSTVFLNLFTQADR